MFENERLEGQLFAPANAGSSSCGVPGVTPPAWLRSASGFGGRNPVRRGRNARATSGPIDATRFRGCGCAPVSPVTFAWSVPNGADANGSVNRLADAPFKRPGVAGGGVRIARFGIELITVKRADALGFVAVDVPGSPEGQHGGPVAQTWKCRGPSRRVAHGHPFADAEAEIEWLRVPGERGFGENVAEPKGAVVESASGQFAVDEGDHDVCAQVCSQEFHIRNPDWPKYAGIGKGLEICWPGPVPGRIVQVVRRVEKVVISHVKAGGGSVAAVMP